MATHTIQRAIVAIIASGASAILPARSSHAAPPDVETPSILPGRPDADKPSAQAAQQLGVPFESAAAGIAFSPPARMKEMPRLPGDTIVRYVDDDRHWVMTVSKLNFRKDVYLSSATTQPMKSTSANSTPDFTPDAASNKGLLESTADRMKLDAPGVEILRQDVVTIAGADVGMLAARYSVGPQTNLSQQAIFRVDDQNYYLFDLTGPVSRIGKISDDPAAATEVSTFNSVLDTVRLLEQTAIREEQEQWLFHTRTLLVNLTPEKLRNALVKEQWLRLLKDGKDIGYSYVVEEVGRDLPRAGHKDSEFGGGDEGPLIGIRSRTYPETGVRVDAESWMWMSFDRKDEKWSNVAVIERPAVAGKPQRKVVGDVGSAVTHSRTVYDQKLVGHGEEIGKGVLDKTQPPFRSVDVHTLHVEYTGDQNHTPFEQELSVFYIPQALAYLLPELMPLHQPNHFMLASYVPEKRAIMMRYVDVGAEDQFTIGKQLTDATPVGDRFGLEGAVTTNYISPGGNYLGSSSPATKVDVLPSDAATLQQIWKDVDLSRPGAVSDLPPAATGAP